MVNEEALKISFKESNDKCNYDSIKKILVLSDIKNHSDIYKTYEAKVITNGLAFFEIFNANVEYYVRDSNSYARFNSLAEILEVNVNVFKTKNWHNIQFSEFDMIVCTDDNEYELFNYVKENNLSRNRKHISLPIFVISLKTDLDQKIIYFEKIESLFSKANFHNPNNRNLCVNIKLIDKWLSRTVKIIKEENSQLFNELSPGDDNFYLEKIKNIIILEDFNKFFIGDTCFYISYLKKLIKIFGSEAIIYINCRNTQKFSMFKQLIKNITIVDNITINKNWNQINFNSYDLILCNRDIEFDFITHIKNNYIAKANYYKSFKVFSICDMVHLSFSQYSIFENIDSILKKCNIDIDHLRSYEREIIVNDVEINWADDWLEKQGIDSNDEIAILLDISFRREKMLSKDAYIELVDWFISENESSVLIFDPYKLGTKQLITEILGIEKAKRIVVAEGMDLRKSISLLGSRNINAIIGPCTGLMHIADCLYSYLLNKKKLKMDDLPLMLVYSGYQGKGYNPWSWWNNSLVHCVIACKNYHDQTKLIPLNVCPSNTEWFDENLISIKNITGKSLISYFTNA